MANLENIGQRFKEFDTLNDKGIPSIIQNWGNELIAQMRNNLTKNKSNASSQLLQSMIGEVTTPPTGYNLVVSMLDYYVNVEEGQKPGTKVAQKNIYKWIENKADIQNRIISKSPDRIAATRSLAYVITRKIFREGTQAKPFIRPALKQVTTDVLSKRISKYIVESLTGE
jgi:hypothetical protein